MTQLHLEDVAVEIDRILGND